MCVQQIFLGYFEITLYTEAVLWRKRVHPVDIQIIAFCLSNVCVTMPLYISCFMLLAIQYTGTEATDIYIQY